MFQRARSGLQYVLQTMFSFQVACSYGLNQEPVSNLLSATPDSTGRYSQHLMRNPGTNPGAVHGILTAGSVTLTLIYPRISRVSSCSYYFIFASYTPNTDRLCDLVTTDSEVPGSIPGATRSSVK
jgi:hypothetical protein